ncbi:Glycolipid 2-alpha-mannosyltransferase 2 [Daldinia childiae]|uniref:Glycolipid 2-alpha-mannosyltransferase 2 n=1 Tax=Daldinia childiae TaxID=326645 RepID=UPI0014462D84|nr:Glycolipid 2-alpha-mannosyltransferase 2 [Daldinia childiae]KAF3055187.1 Glycolipid 2-alpha-mannosyltransferase 2 [Daldinia childiae]
MPLSLTPQQNETGDDTLAIAPENAVEPTHSKIQGFSSWNFLPRRVRPFSFRKVVIFCLASALVGSAWLSTWEPEKSINLETPVIDAYVPPMPHPPAGYTIQADTSHPIQWLRKNTILDLQDLPTQQVQALIETRPKAAFISLVRNEEVEEMVASILQVEARFNSRETHGYDWVFFNNEEFTEEFKAIVSGATDSQCYFERIPQEHWRIPSWIDINRFDIGRQFMGGIGVGKAWLQSYHHMCRWNAGIFASEKRLANYDWFWRVEPAVQFSCDINYDVFRFMQDNNMAYGFNMAILDDARSFPSLWERTKEFIDHNEELVDEDADFNWLLYTAEDHDDVIRPHTGAKEGLGDGEYNNCQFYSNFEIGSLKFFRSKEHMAYFDHLDKAGGFYYERFGDAPVHTLSVSMFLPKSRIWYFRDIGYAHGLCEQCPPHEHPLASRLQRKALLPQEVEQEVSKPIKDDTRTMMEGPFESFGSKHRRWTTMAQDVERQKGIPSLACGCTVNAIDSNNAKLVPYESKQRKPSDPCIRKFLGGKWLVKKDKVSDFNSDTGIIRSSDSVEYVLDGRDGNPFQ